MAPEVIVEQVSAKANWKSQKARNATPVEPYVAGTSCRKKNSVPKNGVARAEHEGEAPGVEEEPAETGVDDALHEDVDRLARAAEAGFEHGEAGLHAEDEERRDERPHRVDRVDDVVALQHGRRRHAPWCRRRSSATRSSRAASRCRAPCRRAAGSHIGATRDPAIVRAAARACRCAAGYRFRPPTSSFSLRPPRCSSVHQFRHRRCPAFSTLVRHAFRSGVRRRQSATPVPLHLWLDARATRGWRRAVPIGGPLLPMPPAC